MAPLRPWPIFVGSDLDQSDEGSIIPPPEGSDDDSEGSDVPSLWGWGSDDESDNVSEGSYDSLVEHEITGSGGQASAVQALGPCYGLRDWDAVWEPYLVHGRRIIRVYTSERRSRLSPRPSFKSLRVSHYC